MIAEDEIYRVIKDIVLSARLPPGTRLPETRIAPLFGVTRERLRKILHRLGHEHTLDIVPNIGVLVPAPSLERARELFEARRVLESGIGMQLCEKITDAGLRRLREHLDREARTAREGRRPDFIMVSSQFHLLLADLLGNELVSIQLDALLARSALFSAFHDPGNASACSCHEHLQIVDALERRDAAAVYYATVAHLSLIETRLQPEQRDPRKADVEAVFRDYLAAGRRPA
ncbi:GntR family transcriptional regulator [uncultured Castellaniella sp.]|uniref:GntR family transcriptional regulator n=1 Tax=uncultured Castellaniella sp. TaxID=647907 RepID=UPI00261120BF|nr:GntR family transcriptional regulator [uncultured Castellaniella sp.]